MFDINDCYLVRKTDIFPENDIVQSPINGRAYDFAIPDFLNDVICDMVNDYLGTKYDFSDESIQKFNQELNKYKVYFETYRRTIHFTIDGVVQNSPYGSFNYPFAIVEPLKYHVNDPGLLSLRVEDTYFSNDLTLSDECVIFVPDSLLAKLSQKYNLHHFNIQTYTGSLEEAIEKYFYEHDMPFFTVNDHGYLYGIDDDTLDSEMYKFIANYAEIHGISQERHFNSAINREDLQMKLDKGRETDSRFLNYLLDSPYVSTELAQNIRNLLPKIDYQKDQINTLFTQMINEMGLKRLQEIITDFNNMMLEEREEQIKSNYVR